MSRDFEPTTTSRPTDYEPRVVNDVAAWNDRTRGIYGRVATRLSRPLAKVVSRVVPQRAST